MKANLVAVLALALVSCNQQPPARPETPTATQPPPFVLTDESRAKLASADAADGKTDHVIEKCVTCRLLMPGNPKYAVTAGDYQVRLCSPECKTAFEKDPGKALLALGN